MRVGQKGLDSFVSRLLSDRRFLERVRRDPQREAARYGLGQGQLDAALDGDAMRLLALGVSPAVLEPPKPTRFWLGPALMRMGAVGATALLALSFLGAAPNTTDGPRARVVLKRAGNSGRRIAHPIRARAARARAARAGIRARYFTARSWGGARAGSIWGRARARAERRAFTGSPWGAYADGGDALQAMQTVWPDLEQVGGDEPPVIVD